MSFIKKASDNYDPEKLDAIIIASRPGMGKTSMLMQIPNSIIFDYEGSSGYYQGSADVVNIKEIVDQQNADPNKPNTNPIAATKMVLAEIKKSGTKYDACIIDTITKIDEFAEKVALVDYKATPQGKAFAGDSVMTLEYGLGYTFHRTAFKKLIDMFDGVGKSLVLCAHVKDASIKKNGESVAINDLALTGSLKQIFSAKQDACGILTMDKEEPNKRYLDFRKIEEGDFVKTRAEHLRGERILISEMVGGKLTTNWNKVFTRMGTSPKSPIPAVTK